MVYRFNRIPELEYKMILDRSFCTEIFITEEEINCELVSKAKFRNKLQTITTKAFSNEMSLLKAIDDLLSKRENILKTLSQYSARIYPFTDEEEIEEEKELPATEETEEMPKEMPLDDVGEEAYEEERCMEVIAKNAEVLKKPIEVYLEAYMKLCGLLLDSSIKSRDHALELISQLANLDTIAVKKHDLSGSILIPLDISPQRLALALNSPAVLDEKRSDTLYIPPVMARRINGKNIVFHAYRSIDDYPVLFPGIHMEEKEMGRERETRFHQEIADATKIMYKLKRGRRGARFPLAELSEIIKVYLEMFPLAQDKLTLVDLGSGRGGLLKAIADKFIREYAGQLLDDRSTWQVVLNDVYEEERTGEEFVRYAATDRASGLIKEVRKIIGDIGKATNLLISYYADICFINRVLDMYAKYGFYWVDVNENHDTLPSAAVEQKEDTEYRGTVLAYTRLIRFKDLYNLQRQLLRHEELRQRTALPGVSFDLKKDFFEPRAFSLEDLVNMSRLVVISIFPATKETLFKNLMNEKTHICSIGEHDLSTKPRYIIFCLSREKEIVEAMSKHFDATKLDC
jgi:hypothetical protein